MRPIRALHALLCSLAIAAPGLADDAAARPAAPPLHEIRTALPDGVVLDRVAVEGSTVTVFLTVGTAFRESRAEAELRIEELHHRIVETLSGSPDLRVFHVVGRRRSGDAYIALDRLLAPPPPPGGKPGEPAAGHDLGGPPGLGQGQPQGTLSGKSIFLSQGHGWYWASCCGWTTQRGVTNGIVEDFINAEAINQYLIQYLWNAGAQVFATRDRDMRTEVVIVDNDGGNGTSDYAEVGAWTTSTSAGFANGNAPYGLTTDPFSLGTTRVLPVSATETGRATFTPDVPAAGHYWVQIAWAGSSNRAPDAHVIVNHAGGTTHLRVNQRLDGHTWRPVGQFYFPAGKNAATGSIVVANDSTSAGAYVSVDAIRLGGGSGEIVDGGTVSGKPRWEEAARYYTQYLGFSAWNYNDVTTRPNWAEWECEAGEDCLYFSWHTNAPNPGTGTSSYIYDGGFTPGSDVLQDRVHDEIVKDIRSGWDPAWRDRGKLQANFGEVRPLVSMPGLLLELAFHDTPYDADQLKDARFRMLAARAIYQGMVRYYNPTATLLPEPPLELRARNLGGGSVRLDWIPAPPDGVDLGGDPATGYRVYVSDNGLGWRDAVPATGTGSTVSGLQPGRVYYFRVSATNAGGESFPTEAVAARVGAANPPLLLVSGFDRIDGSALIPKSDTIGTNLRMDLRRMNSYDYVIAHGEAIAAANVDFDGATNEAVISGAVTLPGYTAIDWILGEESTEHDTFDATEQSLVATYLQGGGRLFLSGAEIGWDLVAMGNGQTFYEDSLKATYEDDDAYTGAATPANEATGTAGGIFAGLTGIRFDGYPPVIYDVDYPDVLSARGGSLVALDYVNATTTTSGAAVTYTGTSRVVHFGFPFEAILDAGMRAAMMGRILTFFGLPPSGPATVDILTGPGLGDPNPNTVKVFTGSGGSNPVTFPAYGAGRWGANVAAAELASGGNEEILTGAGPGAIFGPHVRGFDRAGVAAPGLSFYAYGTLKYGVNVDGGAIEGGTTSRVVTGAGPGEVFGPHVRAFRYTGAAVQAIAKVNFFAFGTLKYGVNVATGDIDLDGADELLAGAGPGASFGASVRGFDYDNVAVTAISKVNFQAWTSGGFGANVSAGDVDGASRDEILVARGPGATLGADVRGYRLTGTGLTLLGIDFPAYAGTFYGGRVGAGHVQGDAREEILTGPGRDAAAPANVRAYAYDAGGNTTTKLGVPDFTAYTGLGYGVNVAGAALGY